MVHLYAASGRGAGKAEEEEEQQEMFYSMDTARRLGAPGRRLFVQF